jgi:hypothetical protein
MEGDRPNINVKRLSVEQLSQLLSNRYRKLVPADRISSDIASGAPTNADGTVDLVAYAAWLLQEKHRGD